MRINTDMLLKKAYNNWWESSSSFPEGLFPLDKKSKLTMEKELNSFITSFDYYSINREFNESNKLFMEENIKKNAKRILNLENSNFSDVFLNDLMESTKDFLQKSKSFDEDVRFMDIAQAIRNVWIINLLQFLLEKPIHLSHSAFAYSMLYPYTDNVLDSELSAEKKSSIFSQFGERLCGKILSPNSTYEEKLFSLVSCFEKDFSRDENPHVYESLLLIHNAQIGSLVQQKDRFSPSYVNDILGITFLKGGSSVLADGFIAKHELLEEEMAVIFGFGVLLQLIDDLQDLEEDLKNGHMTIFSKNAQTFPLDSLLNKLLNFTFAITDDMKKIKSTRANDIATLILDNCVYMIFEAVSRNRRYFTRKFIREIEGYSKVHFKYLKNLRSEFVKKYNKLCKNKNNFEAFILNKS